MYISCKRPRNIFPKHFKEVLSNCCLSYPKIAKRLNIPKRRMYGLVYGRGTKMDKHEFRLISDFVKGLESD